MPKYSILIFTLATTVNIAQAMPHPSSVCGGLLETVSMSSAHRPEYIRNLPEGLLPFRQESAPDLGRYTELVSDLENPRAEDRNFVLRVEDGNISQQFVSVAMDEIKRNSKSARNEDVSFHFISIGTMGLVIGNWTKQLLGIPLKGRKVKIFSGWMGLVPFLGGAAWFVVDNPIIKLDHFLYMTLQNDWRIYGELTQVRNALENGDTRPFHISRNFVLTAHTWKKVLSHDKEEKLTLNNRWGGQMSQDTASLYQRFYTVIARVARGEKPPAKLQVKMDLMTNPATGKTVLLFRTRPESY